MSDADGASAGGSARRSARSFEGAGEKVVGLFVRTAISRRTLDAISEVGLHFLQQETGNTWTLDVYHPLTLSSFFQLNGLYLPGKTNGIVMEFKEDVMELAHLFPVVCLLPDDREERVHVGVFVISAEGEGTTYDWMICTFGSEKSTRRILEMLSSVWDTTLALPQNKYASFIKRMYAEQNFFSAFHKSYYTVVCNQTELYSLLKHSATSLITKTLSIMWFYYPWTRHRLVNKSSMKSYCELFQNLTPSPSKKMNEADTTNFQLYVTTLMLMSAYSRPGDFPRHIESRFKALKASYGSAIPAHLDAATIIASLNINVKNRLNIPVEAAGYWLSVDQEGNYHPELTLQELGDPVTLKKQGLLDHPFPMALMEQGRLVYLNCRLTTTQWALDVCKRVQSHLGGVSSGWTNDYKVLEENADLISSYPYAGLRIFEHKLIKTRRFPRMALLGVAVRKKMLDPTQAAELEHYVTSNFTSNLFPHEILELELLTIICAVPVEETYLASIQYSPIDVAEDLVARIPVEQVERIKRRLYAMQNMGAWATEKFEIDHAQLAGALASE